MTRKDRNINWVTKQQFLSIALHTEIVPTSSGVLPQKMSIHVNFIVARVALDLL